MCVCMHIQCSLSKGSQCVVECVDMCVCGCIVQSITKQKCLYNMHVPCKYSVTENCYGKKIQTNTAILYQAVPS